MCFTRSAFPKAGAAYEYTRQAMGQRAAFVVGWPIVIGNLVAAAAVALGLGAYVSELVGGNRTALAVADSWSPCRWVSITRD